MISIIDDDSLRRLPIPAPQLLHWAGPELAAARNELRRRMETSELGHSARRLAELALAELPHRLLVRLLHRPLVLELNVMRAQQLLVGDTSTARFDWFVEQLADESFREALWAKYPVARTALVQHLRTWNANVLELVEQFDADLPRLRDLLATTEDPVPETLTLASGDSHRGGKSVAVIGLRGGGRLVHKPRSGAPEVLFAEAVAWANRSGFAPALSATAALDLGSHSWVRASEPAPLTSREDAHRFHQRVGGLLALSYVLSLTDVHRENLVAAGPDPVVIDLETLLHTSLRTEGAADDPERTVRALTMSSVLLTGLLPSPRLHRVGDDLLASDVSGLSGDATGPTALGEPWFDDVGTDTMRVSVRKTALGAAQNVPVLDGVQLDPLVFEPDLLDGFERMYRLCHRHRADLLAATGPLATASSTPVRHITGASEMFARLLWNSHHPDFLREPGARESFLARVRARHGDLANGDLLAASEHRQLVDGDIPVFHAVGDSHALTGGDGTVVPDVLRSSPTEVLRSRLESLSEQDCDHQRAVLQGSLRSVVRHGSDRWPAPPPRGRADDTHGDDGAWALRESVAIGRSLLRSAAWVDDQPHWLDHELQGGAYWTPRPAGDDLYAGRPGIGVFLARLGHAVGDDAFVDVARRILDGVLARPRGDAGRGSAPLGFASAADGAVTLAATLADVTGDTAPLAALLDGLHEAYRDAVAADTVHDVIGGTAGTLLTLTATTAHLPPSPALLALVEHGCDHLAAAVRRSGTGAGWPSAIGSGAPLSGFSHGSAGITLALARGALLLGTERFDAVIESALRAESDRFDDRRFGWPDARPGDATPMSAWCHGTPGVALARASMPDRHHRGVVVDDLRKASAVLRRRHGIDGPRATASDLSLCHGMLGELMIIDTVTAHDPELVPVRDRLLHDVRDSVRRRGWGCGAPAGLRTVDLFTGLAGLGLGLLAASAPGTVPTVLAGDTVRRDAAEVHG